MEKMLLLFVILGFLPAVIWIVSANNTVPNLSCEYNAMTEFLHELATNYSGTAKLISIGKTVEDRDIWTMIVSDSPNKRPLLRPQVKFVGNVNGMSGSACYVLLRLVKHLLEEYKSEASMERKLMENMEIHIIPNLNPDGYAKSIPGSCYGKEGRLNANDANLNTNFPDVFNQGMGPPTQVETNAMTRWMDMNNFVISVSVISGAQVVVYPFDTVIMDNVDLPSQIEAHLTPDDEIFKYLSLKYAEKTGTPEHGWYCPTIGRQFPNGIINGAEWHPQSGTMMDFNYIHGTFEIMVGVACCRNENNETLLDEYWWRNREGLLHVIHEAEGGIRGQVLDSETYDAIEGANLSKRSHDYIEGDTDAPYSLPWFTSTQGEFWRPWRPGRYKLQVEKEGYKVKLIPVEVHRRQPTFIRVELEKVEPTTNPHPVTSTSRYMTTKQDFPSKTVPFIKLEEFMNATTGSPDSSLATEASNDGADMHESTNTKQYSSLTQLDHSFINLLRGVQIRNSAAATVMTSSYFSKVVLTVLPIFIRRYYFLLQF